MSSASGSPGVAGSPPEPWLPWPEFGDPPSPDPDAELPWPEPPWHDPENPLRHFDHSFLSGQSFGSTLQESRGRKNLRSRRLGPGGATGGSRLRRMQESLPVAERPRRPEWMKVRAPSRDGRYYDVQKLDPRRVAEHDLRGGALPEHRRVLGARDGHVPDPRRDVHPRVPLLLRQLGHTVRRRSIRSSRCGSRRRRRRWSSSTSWSRRSTATTCPTAAPGTTRRRSARCARRCRTRRSRC